MGGRTAGSCPKELNGTEGKAQGRFKGELTEPEDLGRQPELHSLGWLLGNQSLDQAGEKSKLPHRSLLINLTPSYSIDPAQNLFSTGGKIGMEGNSGSRESGKAEHKKDLAENF